MSEATAADRQKAFLDKARKLYSDSKFKAALVAFKEALLRCPCTRDVMVQSKKMGLSLKEIQISRCHCKDFELLPTLNSPKLAMYTLAKRACTCGSDVSHCNVPSHLNALDGIIATYEKLEAPVKAYQYATLLIITSPRAPEGYLRLAKALRLCDTSQSPETITRCRWIYRQAIQSVQTHGDKDHPKLKIMADLLRMDILASVPAELQTMILEILGNSDLCRSMRVSKTWKTACLDPFLWRHLTFAGTSRRNLRKGVFNNIITKRAQCKVKSLALSGVLKLNIDLPILKATLKVLNQLESLSVHGSMLHEEGCLAGQGLPPSDTWYKTLFEEAPPSLKALHIAGLLPVDVPGLRSATSAIPMAQTLEKLCLDHITTASVGLTLFSSTSWPKLRSLSMAAYSRGRPLEINLERIAQVTPSLKHLCLRDFRPREENSTPSWKTLERLRLLLQTHGQGMMNHMHSLPRLVPTIRFLAFHDRALMTLRHYQKISQEYPGIALNNQNPPNSQVVFNNRVLPPVTKLERLEHLYLRDPSLQFAHTVNGLESLTWFMDLIEPSMSNGSLTSLAVTFCPQFQVELDRVLSKDAVRTLSCFDFREEGRGSQCGDSFANWVQGFHNLTTVGVFPDHSEGCWMHVSKVLAKESRIETIYTDILTGQARDWVLAKAQEKGVRIIEANRIPEPVLQSRDGFS